MSLETYLDHICNDAICFPDGLKKLETLFNNAIVQTTFWGGRFVKIEGCTGTIQIDGLASRILNVGSIKDKNETLTPQDCTCGVNCINKMRGLYLISDRKIAESNLLTRIFDSIRQFTIWPYTARFHIEHESGHGMDFFHIPTRAQCRANVERSTGTGTIIR